MIFLDLVFKGWLGWSVVLLLLLFLLLFVTLNPFLYLLCIFHYGNLWDFFTAVVAAAVVSLRSNVAAVQNLYFEKEL